MLRQMECDNCGHINTIDTDKFAQAYCEACKEKFSEELPLSAYQSEEQLASALKTETPYSKEDTINTNEWTSNIGDANQQEVYVKKNILKKLKKHAAKIPFAKHALAMYYCAVDSKTPLKVKVTAMGALAYLVLPLDLIPDFILVLGYTDDATAFWIAFRSIQSHITDEHRQQAEKWFVS